MVADCHKDFLLDVGSRIIFHPASKTASDRSIFRILMIDFRYYGATATSRARYERLVLGMAA
jgi:hypothetical protein